MNVLLYLVVLATLVLVEASPALSQGANVNDSLGRLHSHETQDPILVPAVGQARELLLAAVSSTNLKDLRLFVTDFQSRSRDYWGKYYTDSCQAILDGTPVIICNSTFLAETEAVIRSFEYPNKYFESDDNLFDLVRFVRASPRMSLQSLRRRAEAGLDKKQNVDSREMTDHIILHLKLVMLFFGGHEIEHLLKFQDYRRFTTFLAPGTRLEKNIVNAVVKMCRQAEEFDELGFGLPGFKQILVDERIRNTEVGFREKVGTLYKNYKLFYEQETQADESAARLVLQYLERLENQNRHRALQEQYVLSESLYFLAIYYWYKDFLTFMESGCPLGSRNSQQFIICMMTHRDQYVKAASLFGDVHRPILLRAVTLLERVIDQRTNYFRLPAEERTIWVSKEQLQSVEPKKAQEMVWHYGMLQSYFLLSILMDTPVKLSYTGCATGWFKEMDKKRGTPQLFMMEFEPINQALGRLTKIP